MPFLPAQVTALRLMPLRAASSIPMAGLRHTSATSQLHGKAESSVVALISETRHIWYPAVPLLKHLVQAEGLLRNGPRRPLSLSMWDSVLLGCVSTFPS